MDKLNQSINWLKEQAEQLEYAEITLKIIIHQNQVKRIEKTITEKEQPEN